MRHLFNLKSGELILENGRSYICTCDVRNLENGRRTRGQVIRSIPDNLPYSPQKFPKGEWKITGIEYRKDKGFDRSTYGDVKIRTNAMQKVQVWETDADGDYVRPSGRYVDDIGYLLHESPASKTTLGCIRLPDGKGLEIAGYIKIGDELEVT